MKTKTESPSRRQNVENFFSNVLKNSLILDCFLQQKREHIPNFKLEFPMNRFKTTLLLAMASLAFISCQDKQNISTVPSNLAFVATNSSGNQPTPSFLRTSKGKIKNAPKKESIYSKDRFENLNLPPLDERMQSALNDHLKVIAKRKGKKNQEVGGLDVSLSKLEETIQILLEHASEPELIKQKLEPHQIWGRDKKGHVQFTGYYAPVIDAKTQPDEVYKYPIYAMPKDWDGPLPTREEIDGDGALQGLGLELAYASNPVDIYYLQVQGSGYVKFVDTGKKKLLRFNGSNGKRYRSIERYLMKMEDVKIGDISNEGIKRFLLKNPDLQNEVLFSNPSYTFFRFSNSVVKGAGGVQLRKDISIAVDTDYLPLGSVALASMPVYNAKGKLSHHEYKILLAQDVGGAIRGAGHVDVYSGEGKSGKKMANKRYHYGEMWILLPKDVQHLALN